MSFSTGLFGHSAVVRKKNFLVVTGGYQGSVSDTAMVYTFPYALAMTNNDEVRTRRCIKNGASLNHSLLKY